MGQDDGKIVERVLAGDRDAFGLLIDRHRAGAIRFALRILRVRADAEDVVQEAWLHAFLELDQLRARDRFVAWLLGIVVNLAKSRLRSRRETPVEDWAGGRSIHGFVWMDAEPPPDARQEARELHDRARSGPGVGAGSTSRRCVMAAGQGRIFCFSGSRGLRYQ